MRQHFVVADSTFSRSDQLWHPDFHFACDVRLDIMSQVHNERGCIPCFNCDLGVKLRVFLSGRRTELWLDVLLIVSLKFYVSITVLQRSQGYQVFDFCFSHDSQSRSSRGLQLEILILGTRHVFDSITSRTVSILMLSDIDLNARNSLEIGVALDSDQSVKFQKRFIAYLTYLRKEIYWF